MDLLISTAAIFFCFSLLTYHINKLKTGEKEKMEKRMTTVVGAKPLPARQFELSFPLYQRFIKPTLTKLFDSITKFMPAAGEDVLAKKLIQAGEPYNLSAREWFVVKYLLVGFSAWGLHALWRLSGKSAIQCIFIAIIGGMVGWMIPDIIINSRIRQRKEDVEKQLPDVLDMLTVCIEAGLGFDGAMMKVVEKYQGVLADGLGIVLEEIRMGKPRREALRELADRLEVDDLSNFVGSVIMAEQLGISMGNVLRLQSKEIRQKRRQKVEELAMKAPVKMLLPMVMFIFPAIFIVLLGPAVMQIMDAFK